MATPPLDLETWYEPVIEIMIAERIPLLMAVTRYGAQDIALTPEECAGHERRKSFKDLYRAMLRKHYMEAASPVDHTKTILVGRMLANAKSLETMGKVKEANEALMGVARVEGWVGGEQTVNIFDSLTGADYQKLKDSVEQRKKGTIQ